MSASGSAAQRRRAFIERIERLEEERKSLADDIASVYDELKDDGHDKAAVKIIVKIRRKKDGLAKWVGHSGTVDEYLADLGMLPKFEEARAGARVRENIEQFPPHDHETGELTDTQEQPEEPATQSVQPPVTAVVSEYAGTSSDENPAPISNPQPPILSGNADSASEAGTPPPASDATDFDPSKLTFLTGTARKTAADYRPNCMNPDACGASGLTECYSCRKAMEAASETEAA